MSSNNFVCIRPRFRKVARYFCSTCLLVESLVGTLFGLQFGYCAQAQETAETPAVRYSHLTSYVSRGKMLATSQSVTWFDVDGQQFWFATQMAKSTAIGNAVLVASDGINSLSHMAKLRTGLARYGWNTHYLSPTGMDAELEQVLVAGLANLPQAKLLLIACEGAVCLQLAQLSSRIEAVGFVYVNLPITQIGAQGTSPALNNLLKPFTQMRSAGLILQEHPAAWPVHQPLAADIELHLLPVARANTANTRVLRKLRGWLKRRHKLPS